MIYCASNGKPCDGICRKENLERERKILSKCPAAYGSVAKQPQSKFLIKRDFKWH